MAKRPVKKILIILLATLLVAVFGFFIWLEEDSGGNFFLSGFFNAKFYDNTVSGYFAGKLCNKEIKRFLNDFEQRASAHIEDSEVSKFNRAKAGEKVPVSHHVYKLFEISQEYYQKSGGAFNYCLYDLSKLWGFLDDQGFFGPEEIPSREQTDALLTYADPDKIVLNGDGTVTKLDVNVKVDFGAVAKGYALDVCREIAKKYGIKSALFNLAGNINAIGYKDNANGAQYKIGITDPRSLENDNLYFAELFISDTSISVSGDYERYFIEDGVRYCHIIDPFTGRPVNTEGAGGDGIISVVVKGGNAAMADAFSTAVMVSGIQKGIELLEANGLSGVIITQDKKYYVVGDIDLSNAIIYERAEWNSSKR